MCVCVCGGGGGGGGLRLASGKYLESQGLSSVLGFRVWGFGCDLGTRAELWAFLSITWCA